MPAMAYFGGSLADQFRELVAIGDIQLEARAIHVAFDGTNRQRQLLGDLLVGQPGGDEFGDLPLAGGHRQWPCGGFDGRRRSAAALIGKPQCSGG